MSDNNDIKDDVVVQLFPDVPEAVHPDGHELQEYVFTNDPTNPAPEMLFKLLHDSAFKNKLGVMHALDVEESKIVTLIVGVDFDEEGKVIAWPIAKMLTEAEQKEFKSPDGHGNWI